MTRCEVRWCGLSPPDDNRKCIGEERRRIIRLVYWAWVRCLFAEGALTPRTCSASVHGGHRGRRLHYPLKEPGTSPRGCTTAGQDLPALQDASTPHRDKCLTFRFEGSGRGRVYLYKPAHTEMCRWETLCLKPNKKKERSESNSQCGVSLVRSQNICAYLEGVDWRVTRDCIVIYRFILYFLKSRSSLKLTAIRIYIWMSLSLVK